MAAEPIFTLRVAPIRRGFALTILGVLFLACVWLCLTVDSGIRSWVAFTMAAIWGGCALNIAVFSARALHLYDDRLETDRTTPLFNLDDVLEIQQAERAGRKGAALVVRLRAPLGATWHVGLFWRFGARIGIGGLTAPHDIAMLGDHLESLLNLHAKQG